MGIVTSLLDIIFGDGMRKTAQVFYENRENRAQREHTYKSEALNQFASEFQLHNRGGFDRFIDGINRIPRPAMAFGVIGLFVAALVDPIWFSARMQGLALVPDPLWWLLGAIVSFYFGARHQAKLMQQTFDVTKSMHDTKKIRNAVQEIEHLSNDNPLKSIDDNPALSDWQQR